MELGPQTITEMVLWDLVPQFVNPENRPAARDVKEAS